MRIAKSKGSESLEEAVGLHAILCESDPTDVLQWIFPSIMPRTIDAWIRSQNHEIVRQPTALGPDLHAVRSLFRTLESILATRRLSAPSSGAVQVFRRFVSPHFNSAPCACILILRSFDSTRHVIAVRRLANALCRHYLESLSLAQEIGVESDGGFHDWIGAVTKKDIDDFLRQISRFQQEVAHCKTAAGGPSRRPVNSYFQYLNRMARNHSASSNPPADAAEATWIVIREFANNLESHVWYDWRSSMLARCKHEGVKRVLDRIDEVKQQDERSCLQTLLEDYLRPS